MLLLLPQRCVTSWQDVAVTSSCKLQRSLLTPVAGTPETH